MTSSINDKIREQVKEKKILEKQKQENAEKLLHDVPVLEDEEMVEKPKPKAKAKAKKSVKKSVVKKSKK